MIELVKLLIRLLSHYVGVLLRLSVWVDRIEIVVVVLWLSRTVTEYFINIGIVYLVNVVINAVVASDTVGIVSLFGDDNLPSKLDILNRVTLILLPFCFELVLVFFILFILKQLHLIIQVQHFLLKRLPDFVH